MGILILIIIAIVAAIAISIQNQNSRGESICKTKSSLEQNGFYVSKQVTDTENKYSILIDDKNQKWAVIIGKSGESSIYKYSDLVEYEILEDGNSIVKGRVGSVVAGGLLFGGVGALAGGARSKKVKNTCRSLKINIVVNNLSKPQIIIPLISAETKTGSFVYNGATAKAKEIASVLAIIKVKAEQEQGITESKSSKSNAQLNASDEIEKLFALKEKGIITEEEFSKKKKQLLGI